LVTTCGPLARLRQILVLNHPLIEVSKCKRIAAGRVAWDGCRVWMTLSELDAQPNRYSKAVVKLFGSKQAEVLVLSNEFFELAARLNVRGSKLVFDGRPLRAAL
jgi:hypothetical protein